MNGKEHIPPSIEGTNKAKPCYCYETIGEFMKNAHVCNHCGFRDECHTAEIQRITKKYEDNEELREKKIRKLNKLIRR